MAKEAPKVPDLVERSQQLLDGAEAARVELQQRISGLARARLRGELRALELSQAEGAESVSTQRLKAMLTDLSVLSHADEQSRVPALEAEDREAVLHGRVVDARGAGKEGLVVSVLNRKGVEAARVKSGELGYFCFRFPHPKPADKPVKTAKGEPAKPAEAEGKPERKPEEPAVEGGDEASVAQGVEVRVEVRGEKGKRGEATRPTSERVMLGYGLVVYRELTFEEAVREACSGPA